MTSTQPSPTTQAPALLRPQLAQLATSMTQRVSGPGQFARAKLATGLDVILHRMDALRWRLARSRRRLPQRRHTFLGMSPATYPRPRQA